MASGRWSLSKAGRLLAACGAVVLAAIAIVLVSQASGSSDQAQSPAAAVAAFPTESHGPYEYTKRSGLDPASATQVFKSTAGVNVGVVAGNGVRCLVYSDGTDGCVTPVEISLGHSLTVSNDCSANSDHAMMITGLVPSGVATVTLSGSKGVVATTGVVDWAFGFNMTTPIGDAADTAIRTVTWLDANGGIVASHPFPIGPGGYCPGG